jgi:hypothetical protein
MEQAPRQWALGTVRYAESFAEPLGAQRWDETLKRLCQDANTPLPEED